MKPCCTCGEVRQPSPLFVCGHRTWTVCRPCLANFKDQCGQEFPDLLLNPHNANILVSCINEERRSSGQGPIEIPFPPKPDEILEGIAKAFSVVLHRWLNPEQWEELIRKNAADPEDSCSSHDFCDANMAMDEAFRVVLGRAIILPCDAIEGDKEQEAIIDADSVLWNDAWKLAKVRGFFCCDLTHKPTAKALADALRAVLGVVNAPVHRDEHKPTLEKAAELLKRFDA